jgi:7,8-dihydropterin-6-yl-methyl-4-(beta-D-ribofuranosyl)aminobenzene 5'-phosphate synthase
MDPVEKARITVVVDNHVDALLTEREDVKRFTMLNHFVPPHGEPICTENGISYWIELHHGSRRHHVLFDTSLTAHVLLHNLRALGRSADQLDHGVISHAHPDHFGGLLGLLRERQRPLPIAVHPDAFLPKYIIDDSGNSVMTINRRFDRSEIEGAKGVIVDSREPVEVGPGALATGQIPRDEASTFEPPVPKRGPGPAGIFLERDGELVNDDATIDDQAVVLHVRGKGLVVMTACGHSGVVNTIRHAQRITGVGEIYAVMGGFHTGFMGVPEESGAATVEALAEFKPKIVAPMHCTGIKTIARAVSAFPEQFVHNTAGTTITIGDDHAES